MKLHGTLADNLRAAVTSAQRLHGKPVHRETLDHWKNLLTYARERQRARGAQLNPEVAKMIGNLQSELSQREQGR